MNAAAQLIEAADARGVELIPSGDKLRVRGAEPVLADLLEDLRRHKPAIFTRLREHAERRRQAAVSAACDRLEEVYRRAGNLSDWMTASVGKAEAEVEWFWIEARRTDDDRGVSHRPAEMGAKRDGRDPRCGLATGSRMTRNEHLKHLRCQATLRRDRR